MQRPAFIPAAKSTDKLEIHNLGVYRLLLEQGPSLEDVFSVEHFYQLKKTWLKTTKLTERLVREVAGLDPWLVSLLIGVTTWENTQDLILLTLENRILQLIETGLANRSVNVPAFVQAMLIRLFYVAAGSVITRWCRHVRPGLQAAVKNFYDETLMTAQLNMDLPTMQDNTSQENISSGVPWQAFERLLELVTRMIATIGQLGLISLPSSSPITSGHAVCYFFILISASLKVCIARVVEATNEDYLRMRALQGLLDKKYRHDIISGNIVQYIINEFRKARACLGNTSVDYPEDQYHHLKTSFAIETLTDVSGDLPLIYYALLTILRPSQISLTSIASLQQLTTSLRWCFILMYWDARLLRRHLSELQQLYDLLSTSKAVKDGNTPYPNEKQSSRGMSFELRNVSFSYPGNKSEKKALDDVSLRIKGGELVVVVGSNGSGKSTFVNLLTRIYDACSGQVLVDGEDIKRFKLADFRQYTAVFTQEHHLFPLSIAENIGLGYPDAVNDKDMIMEAARLGGAEGIIQKLDSGLDTVLEPVTDQYTALVDENGDSALSVEGKKLRKSSNCSGGERQRLVAARTFMRFNSNRVKFLAVDEPSSALDPEGELELFSNLRKARSGKTMLFVTHRFGPISKYADQIICMKDGKVIESGSHSELMSRKGEYSKLYKIQTKAFGSEFVGTLDE
uniref:ABC transporter domain-containing protein n=1 Tax=Moniliophthora roreri TaxID=221103 RepID=A0A0W0F349_MONRR